MAQPALSEIDRGETKRSPQPTGELDEFVEVCFHYKHAYKHHLLSSAFVSTGLLRVGRNGSQGGLRPFSPTQTDNR